MTSKKLSVWLSWLLFVPLYLWLLGIFHAVDFGRALVLIVGLLFLVKRWRAHCLAPLQMNSLQEKLLWLYIILYPILLFIQHVVRLYEGGQGRDTLIFLQIVERFASSEGLSSTLLDPAPIHFLHHHFSPIMYIPGFLASLSVPTHIAFFICGYIAVTLTLFFFYIFLRQLDYTKTVALLGVVLLAANYNFRHSIEWTFRPETLVYPFIVLAMYFWIKRKHWLVNICLMLTFTGQETFFPYGIFFCFMAVFVFYREKEPLQYKNISPYLITTAIAFIGFIVYFLIKRQLTGITHEAPYNEPTRMIANMSDLLMPSFWVSRFYWIFLILLPLLAFPLYHLRYMRYFIPLLPAVGFIMISTHTKTGPLDYYTAVPTLLLFLGTSVGLGQWKPLWKKSFPCGLAVLLVSIAYFFGGWKPLRTTYRYFTENKIQDLTPLIKRVPEKAKVLMSSSGAGMFGTMTNRFHLISNKYVNPDLKFYSRWFTPSMRKRSQKELAKINYIALGPYDTLKNFPKEITTKVKLCGKNEHVQLYCRIK